MRQVPRWRYRATVQRNVWFQRRRELGLSREECARRLGTSERTLRRLEAGTFVPTPMWDLAYDGLAARLWAESMNRVAELTVRGALLRASDGTAGTIVFPCSVRVEHRNAAEEDSATLTVGEA